MEAALLQQAYGDYFTMMDLAEELIRACADTVCGKREVDYQGEVIDLGSPFRRISMHDLVKEQIGIPFSSCFPLGSYSCHHQSRTSTHINPHVQVSVPPPPFPPLFPPHRTPRLFKSPPCLLPEGWRSSLTRHIPLVKPSFWAQKLFQPSQNWPVAG